MTAFSHKVGFVVPYVSGLRGARQELGERTLFLQVLWVVNSFQNQQ